MVNFRDMPTEVREAAEEVNGGGGFFSKHGARGLAEQSEESLSVGLASKLIGRGAARLGQAPSRSPFT